MNKYKFLPLILLCIAVISIISAQYVHAAELYDMVLNGSNHAIDDFPETYYDSDRDITFYRMDDTLRIEVRDTVSLYYTTQDYCLRNPDEITLTEYYPATTPMEYTDPLTNETFTYDVPAVRYWWSDLGAAELEVKHWGTDHQANKDNMGWMSNNLINYYPTVQITARFSKTPYAPQNISLYFPDTGYPDYDYEISNIEWCGIIQDAQKEPYYSRLIKLYGHASGINFISDTDHENQYRKPIVITFSADITLGYPNVEYQADAPLYDTIVTYTDTP